LFSVVLVVTVLVDENVCLSLMTETLSSILVRYDGCCHNYTVEERFLSTILL